MRSLSFDPAAESEVAAAAEFYNRQQENLGKRFVCAVEEGAARVNVDPFLYPVVDGKVRRCLLSPFCILYRVSKTRVVIVAVMHMHRKPGYWNERN